MEVKIMCYVTATELKNNLSYYLTLSSKEDVYVTKNNKIISVLSNPQDKALENFLSLRGQFGTLDENIDYKDIIGEEIMKK